MFIRFCAVLLAHLLYDFHWQGPFIADNKGKRLFLLIVHALTWALCIWFALLLVGAAVGWQHLVCLFVCHIIPDGWKSRQSREKFYLIYIDQAVHLLTLLWICWIVV